MHLELKHIVKKSRSGGKKVVTSEALDDVRCYSEGMEIEKLVPQRPGERKDSERDKEAHTRTPERRRRVVAQLPQVAACPRQRRRDVQPSRDRRGSNVVNVNGHGPHTVTLPNQGVVVQPKRPGKAHKLSGPVPPV